MPEKKVKRMAHFQGQNAPHGMWEMGARSRLVRRSALAPPLHLSHLMLQWAAHVFVLTGM